MTVDNTTKKRPNTLLEVNGQDLTIRSIRNATVVIKIDGKTLLVDPMFSPKSALDPIPWTNEIRNPTVGLTLSNEEIKEVIQQSDAVVLTHLHPDHWDEAARTLIPKSKAIICQAEDVSTLIEHGFSHLTYSGDTKLENGIRIIRVEAQHGHGELADKMGPASGYIIQGQEKTIYIAGDTVWYEGVEKTIERYNPDVIIVNAGGARFQFGEPITMTTADVLQVVKASKQGAKIIVVHMEAVNHCYLTRSELHLALEEEGIGERCLIPADGEEIVLV